MTSEWQSLLWTKSWQIPETSNTDITSKGFGELCQSPQCSYPLQWRHNERVGVSNHRRLDCLLKRMFGRRSKKTSELRVTGVCEGNPPVTGGFPSQRASYAEIISISWRHHGSHWMRNTAVLQKYYSKALKAKSTLTKICLVSTLLSTVICDDLFRHSGEQLHINTWLTLEKLIRLLYFVVTRGHCMLS